MKTKSILPVLAAGTLAYLMIKGFNKGKQIATDRQRGDGYYPNKNYSVRGYRNNNPLNIVYSSSNNWAGQIVPSGDTRFCQFETMAYGYRAAFRNIRTYINQGQNTLQSIISKWAPAIENNTSGYITRVCNYTGFSPATVISATNEAQMKSLVNAMSLVENGTGVAVPTQAIDGGWYLYIQSI